jgi:hypothetical protein
MDMADAELRVVSTALGFLALRDLSRPRDRDV